MKRVWYHSQCHDGYGSAWAASKVFGRGDDVIYLPCSYKSKVGVPEHNEGDKIYILDFSFPRETLLQIKAKVGPAGAVLVLDHHKTAEEDLKGLDFCVFDMNRSGAGITWDVLVDKPRPVLINLIEDRDLWKFRFPATKAFQSYLRSQPFDFDLWDQINDQMNTDPQPLLAQGESILRFTDTQVKQKIAKGWITEIRGHPAAVCNATGFWSEVGHELLAKFPKASFAVSFGFVPTGEVMWSLRGRGDFDVSEIAKVYGGGGHFSASGMRTKTLAEVFVKWKSPN